MPLQSYVTMTNTRCNSLIPLSWLSFSIFKRTYSVGMKTWLRKMCKILLPHRVLVLCSDAPWQNKHCVREREWRGWHQDYKQCQRRQTCLSQAIFACVTQAPKTSIASLLCQRCVLCIKHMAPLKPGARLPAWGLLRSPLILCGWGSLAETVSGKGGWNSISQRWQRIG